MRLIGRKLEGSNRGFLETGWKQAKTQGQVEEECNGDSEVVDSHIDNLGRN